MAKVLVELLSGIHRASVALSTYVEGLLNSADQTELHQALNLQPGVNVQGHSDRLTEVVSGFVAAQPGQCPRKNAAGTAIEWASIGRKVAPAIARRTGPWSTNSTIYTQLGGASFSVQIAAHAGDLIEIIPPHVSITLSVAGTVYARLQRNGADVIELLGDAESGKEQATWQIFSGSVSDGPGYYGMVQLGQPIVDIAPSDGTFTYSINVRLESSSETIWLGRNAFDAPDYIGRVPSQLIAKNISN